MEPMYHRSWRDETGSVRTTTPSPSASPTLVGDHDYDDDNDMDKASTVSTHLGPESGSPDEWPHDDQDDDSNCADSDDGVVHYDNVTWDHTDLSAWDYKINRYDTIDERPYDDFGSDHDEHDHHGESKDPMLTSVATTWDLKLVPTTVATSSAWTSPRLRMYQMYQSLHP